MTNAARSDVLDHLRVSREAAATVRGFRLVRRHADRRDLVPADLYIARVGSDRDAVVVISSEQSSVLTSPRAWRLRLSRHRIDELPPGLSSLNPGKRFNDLARDV